jgi:hypothetical protein
MALHPSVVLYSFFILLLLYILLKLKQMAPRAASQPIINVNNF